MTPGARVQAAIEVLDVVLDGVAPGPRLTGPSAEAVLTRWARGARYAGSRDRAAVRDHVFSALRQLRSAAARGGSMSGRSVIAGLLASEGGDLASLFDGQGHAPLPLSEAESGNGRRPSAEEDLDMPSWLLPEVRRSLGPRLPEVCEALRHRAPVHLRANLLKTDREGLIADLAEEGVKAVAHPLSPTALEVLGDARGLRNAAALRDGRAEFQDAASQAVADFVPVEPGARILDMCAGGGGKALALAARGAAVSAWDADPSRMKDIPARAARAGASIEILREPGQGWDIILCDAPCSGSGAWRRSPEGKWRLSPERLDELVKIQHEILKDAMTRVSDGGLVVYATCSILHAENSHLIANPLRTLTLTPLDGGDGFHAALFEPSEGRS